MFSRWFVLALILATLAGCVVDRPLARKASAVVARTTPHALTCERADRCAMATPYARLIADADARSTKEKPVHYVNVLERGADALLVRVHLIRAARSSIDVQSFIWANDDAGWLVLDELLAAARRGVRVRVLVDQLFSLDSPDLLAALARAHANFEFRVYNPTFANAVTQPLEFAAGILCCFSNFNQRMHNKLMLIDGEIGIAGGRNYENRYYDWDQNFDYRDRDVLVVGPSAGAEMRTSFEQFWSHPRTVPLTRLNDVNARIVADASIEAGLAAPATLDRRRIETLRTRAMDAGDIERTFVADALEVGAVDYFSDLPNKLLEPTNRDDRALSQRITQLIAGARVRIDMQTPYLVISRRAQRVFGDLHKSQPSLVVTVSTNSLAATDAFYVYALSHKYKKRYLKRYGFRIFEFKPFPGDADELIAGYDALSGGKAVTRFRKYGEAPLKRGGTRIGMHAKSIVIDDDVTLIGSHNFDPRSDHYNTEAGFIIRDRALALRVRGAIERDTQPQNAWVIAKRPRGPRLLDRINNAIADLSTALPLFDFWPFRYSSSFELNPGCAPLPPGDPKFYDCYSDVGDFPEVDLPLKAIYTRVVTAFGAGLAGIL